MFCIKIFILFPTFIISNLINYPLVVKFDILCIHLYYNIDSSLSKYKLADNIRLKL